MSIRRQDRLHGPRAVFSPKFRAKATSWVNRVISSAHKRLPLLTQHQTYRCIALSDEKGHEGTFAPEFAQEKPREFWALTSGQNS